MEIRKLQVCSFSLYGIILFIYCMYVLCMHSINSINVSPEWPCPSFRGCGGRSSRAAARSLIVQNLQVSWREDDPSVFQLKEGLSEWGVTEVKREEKLGYYIYYPIDIWYMLLIKIWRLDCICLIFYCDSSTAKTADQLA